MMRKFVTVGALLFCMVAGACAVVYACADPVAVMVQRTNQFTQHLSQLQSSSGLSKQDLRQKQMAVIRADVIPFVDVNNVSHQVVGGVWRSATEKQKKAFISEFSEMVLRFYLAAFSGNINDYHIKYLPIRGAAHTSDVVVTSIIQSSEGISPVKVRYYLRCIDGKWTITDYDINGISMVQSYRAQFATKLANVGLDGLISAIRSHNNR